MLREKITLNYIKCSFETREGKKGEKTETKANATHRK